jgi:hypothetical protein
MDSLSVNPDYLSSSIPDAKGTCRWYTHPIITIIK